MFNAHPVSTTRFQAGDSVELAEGPCQSTRGVFIRLRQDVKWAEIRERNGTVRCHPVEWLQHAVIIGNSL